MDSSRFIGREAQLELLADELGRVEGAGSGRLLLVRGRRRVGKSALIEEFLVRSGAPAAYFTATGQSPGIELERFRRTLTESSLPVAAELSEGIVAGDWEGTLTQIARSTEAGTPGVLVIDELPYLVEADESIQGVLQVAWDRHLSRVPLLVILVGSDLSVMEALSGYDSPLFGRPSREVVIDPLTPAEILDLLGLEPAAALDAYVVIGGFPQLAISLSEAEDLPGFLRQSFAGYSSPLIVDGERAVAAEFPEGASARQVLRAIGGGGSSFGRIQQRTGIGEAALSDALRLLVEKRVVERATPFGSGKRTRLTRYLIADPYLRFWHRFVEPGMALIERGRGELVAGRVEEAWFEFRGRAIEPVARRSLERLLPLPGIDDGLYISSYWNRSHSVEVDLVGSSEENRGRVAFTGSIKWRERGVFDLSDLDALRGTVEEVPGADPSTPLVAVSRAGFAPDLDGLVERYGPADLIAAWR